MRRVLFTMLALGLLALAALLVARPRTGSAYLNWDYDYGQDLPCTNTRAKSCVSGFNVFVGDPGRDPKPRFVANRSDEKGQLVSKNISTTVNFEGYGHVQFCVTAIGVDATGAAVESRPMCASRFVIPFLVRDVRVSGR
jgi:hypothetical protein